MNEDETQAQDDAQPTTRRALLLALLLLLLQNTLETLTKLSAEYLSGNLSLLELHDGLVAALTDSHAHAAYLGRQLAGSTEPFGAQDTAFAEAVMEGQAQYLEGLLSDFQAGRYSADGASGAGGTGAASGAIPKALAARLVLWALALRGTANAAFGLSLDPQVSIDWILGGSEHCASCVELAAGSPYTAETIPTWPGMGDTECLTRCSCEARITDGGEAFPYMKI